MKNVLYMNNISGQELVSMKVIDKAGEQFVVSNKINTSMVKRAASCLLEPKVEDTVLVFLDGSGDSFILHVLETDHKQKHQLSIEGDLNIVSRAGNLGIQAGKEIQIISNSYTQVSHDAHIQHEQSVLNSQNILVKGQEAHTQFSRVFTIAEQISTMAKRAMQKFDHYVRKSDQSDHVQATQMMRKADGLYSLKSKHTQLISEKDTKIDGEHIHMG